MSINITLSVREAILLLSGGEVSNAVCEQIIKAIEDKCGCGGISVNNTGTLNLTLKKFPPSNRISVIKSIRIATGWGLKESKDFTDVVQGVWQNDGTYINGNPNTLKSSRLTIQRLNNDLLALGCETQID